MALKQDLNGYRTPLDVARRYKLGDIELTKEEIESIRDEIVCDDHLSITSKHPVQNKVVTETLNLKVNKETGKGLSTNDFTDTYKTELETSYTNNHTHSNKSALDEIVAPVVVFNNNYGSNGDITLTSSIENSKYIDIVFGDANYRDCKRVYNPSGKNASLSLSVCTTTDLTIKTEMDSILSTSISRTIRNKVVIDGNGTTITTDASITDSDKLLIYRVISYM